MQRPNMDPRVPGAPVQSGVFSSRPNPCFGPRQHPLSPCFGPSAAPARQPFTSNPCFAPAPTLRKPNQDPNLPPRYGPCF